MKLLLMKIWRCTFKYCSSEEKPSKYYPLQCSTCWLRKEQWFAIEEAKEPKINIVDIYSIWCFWNISCYSNVHPYQYIIYISDNICMLFSLMSAQVASKIEYIFTFLTLTVSHVGPQIFYIWLFIVALITFI